MPGTISPHKVDKGQVEDILFSDIQGTPTDLSGYGITDVYSKSESDGRYVRYDGVQSLSPTEKQQARDNIGVGTGTGTVTSVGLSIDGIFSVSGSPITDSGTIDLALDSQSQYTVFGRGAGSGIPSFISLEEDHIPNLSISKVTGLQTALDDIDSNHYIHPTQSVIDTGVMTGATVVSRVQVNSLGHTQIVSTRTLTPADIGAAPAGLVDLQEATDNGNTTTNNITINNPAGILLNTLEDGTGSNVVFRTRNTNGGGVDIYRRGNLKVIAKGDSPTDNYIFEGRDSSTNVTFKVDNDGTVFHSDAVLDTDSMTLGQYKSDSHVITGLKKFRAGVGGGAETLHSSWEYPDGSGEIYNLRLYNDSDGNNVRWYYKQKVTLGTNDVDLDLPVLGFQNGVTLIGSDTYNNTEVETYYDGQTNPATRFKQSMYILGDSIHNGNLILGQDSYNNTSFLETAGDPFIFSSGVVYGQKGIRTPDPSNPLTIFDHTTWLLGDAVADTTNTATHAIRVSIDGVEFDISARQV